MQFDEIIGQREVVGKLIQEADSGRLPHAILLQGPEGNGGMAIALALAYKLLAVNDNSRAMLAKLQHPDLHMAFPIFKKNPQPKPTYCDEFLKRWRDMVLSNRYFGYQEWAEASGADTQQLMIYESESDALIKKLSIKPSQGGYRVVIIWLPEKMNATCANKILKLLEEPPAGVVFLMVCEKPELLLETVRSRCQRVNVPRLTTEDIEQALTNRYSLDENQAHLVARSSYGSMTAALRNISDDDESELFFDLFVELMRLSYQRKVKEMKLWSERVAAMGREKIKRFLNYSQHMLRENFMYNFHRQELIYMNEREQGFAVKFAPFINENNALGIMEELSLCMRDISQNANAKIVFFDFALKMIVLIKNR